MKALTVVALAIIAGTSGYLIKVPVAPISQPALAPLGWIHLQKLVLPLFQNVCEESTDPVICRLSQEFTTNISAADFWDPYVISKFQNIKSGKGFLPKGQIFSEYNAEHIDELKIILEVMRNAKTFDTFYKVAAWARQNLNCGLYVSLIYLAMENRRDTEKLTLPPPYELLPNYFIRKDIIFQGSSLLAGHEFTPSEGVRDEGNAYTLDANYTANFYENDDESKLAYFREDIGLNSFYFLTMLKKAPWLNDNVDTHYGEEIYHFIKELVARYNLERYSNGMPELDNLSWDSLSDAPYDPMLVYSNGNEFIHRTSSVQLPENEDKALLQTIENNIVTVVSHMKETGYNKTQILNHLMEILITGERSYDTLARHLLGKSLSNNGQPTVFEHYMTSLRDPMIWKLYKNMAGLVDNALKALPPYTKSELYFPGVEVISIDVKKMVTNFDNFEFDITEALTIGNGDTTFQVKIGQPRLNHKPFMVKVNISSLVTQKGLLKIYVGPKMMPGEFAKKKNLFALLDFFEITLKKGSNIVSRASKDMSHFSQDFVSLKTLYKKVEDARFGLDSLPMNSINSQICFPERLIIPKGTPDGVPLQLFVFVAPFVKAKIEGSYSTSSMESNQAVFSPLYPLDLVMEDNILLNLPNALVKDFMVTHKGVSKVSDYGESGAAKSWYDNSAIIEPSKPYYNTNENEPLNYNYKKDQFGQKDKSFFTNDQYFGSQAVSLNGGVQNDESSTELKQNILKTSGIDYSSKQKERYDYQSKRPQYQKIDYSAKKVDYRTIYENKLTENPVDITYDKKSVDTEDKGFNNGYGTENTNRNKYDVGSSVEQNDRTQNVNSPMAVKRILKSSSPIYTAKQKIDYKSKQPNFERPDYKTMYKTAQKSMKELVNTEIQNKTTKQVSLNEDKTKRQYNDPAVKDVQNVDNVEFFKVYERSNKKDSSFMSTDKFDDLVFADVGNIDSYKVSKDINNVNSPSVLPTNKYDQVIVEDVHNTDNGDIFRIYKDESNEEILKVVPVTKSPGPDISANKVYKYIIRPI